MHIDILNRDINLLRKHKIQKRNEPVNPLYNAWAEIDLDVLKNNLTVIRGRLAPGADLLAVVKADAYGHGLEVVSRTALESGAGWLGVTSIAEALELRRLHRNARILILSAGMYDHSRLIVKHHLVPIVCSRQMAQLLNQEGKAAGRKVKVHVKIDTGMGRLGAWHEKAIDFIKHLAQLPYIEIEGICSHFASVSSSRLDMKFTRRQLKDFNSVIRQAEGEGVSIPVKHIANSGAMLLLPEAHLNLVRVGISMYGLCPSDNISTDIGIQPVLSLKSRVAFIKEVLPGRTISYGRMYKIKRKTQVATIPIGYSNGYFRGLTNKGQVLIRGRRAPVTGVVTMDQIMVDVGSIPGVAVGDEVVLIGRQKEEEITARDVARSAGTISYEILCKLKVPRVYFLDEA